MDFTCAVCLSNKSEGFVLLNCLHLFHGLCFRNWLASVSRALCPLCRQEATSYVPIEREAERPINAFLPAGQVRWLTTEYRARGTHFRHFGPRRQSGERWKVMVRSDGFRRKVSSDGDGSKQS